MAIAETAQLMVQLGFKDMLSPGLAKAKAELAGANAAVAGAGGGFSRLEKAAGAAGGAFTTFRGRIGQVLGYTGLAGLGAGLFTLGGLLDKSIHQAADFGTEVYKLQAVTGLSADKTSQLAAVFHHFGIESDTALRIAALGEKNLFAQGETIKKTAAFLQTYGFNLRDASGNLKDFNTLLLDEADYFNNKHIPAATKDAELAKIFGRNWQSLIPVLKAGRTAIADAEVEAQKLGLTLTSKNLTALAKLREATRNWSTALGGLELQIGLKLVPAITDLANAATKWLAAGGREQIVAFFGKLVAFARQAGAILTGPVATGIKAIYSGWMAIPSSLRDLIITGFAANKTIKFLFGFDIAKTLGGTIADLLGGIAKNKLIPQTIVAAAPIPVFVTNPGFGMPGGGGPGGIVGAAEEAGAGGITAAGLGTAALAGAGAALPFAGGILATGNVASQMQQVNNQLSAAGLSTKEIQAIKYAMGDATFQSSFVKHGYIAPTTAEEKAAIDKLAAAGLHLERTADAFKVVSDHSNAGVKAAILAEGAKQSSWRAREQAALTALHVTSLAGNASMNRIQGAVARGAILQSSKLDRLNQLNSATAGNTGIIARKRTNVSINNNITVPVALSVSVNAIQQQLVRLQETVRTAGPRDWSFGST